MFLRTHTARANETYRFSDNPTLSDFPLLIGEVIRRADLRDIRRRRWSSFFGIGKSKAKALTGILEDIDSESGHSERCEPDPRTDQIPVQD